jgi:AAA+ superfamily predicted ATPase
MIDADRDDLSRSIEHLDRILRRATERVLEAYGHEAASDPFRGLYISQSDAERLLDTWPGTPASDGPDVPEAPPLLDEIGEDAPLARLARAYALTGLDLDVILIALAPELDLRYERLYAFLQDDVSRRRPSVDLALNLLCATSELKLARRERFTADAPLIRHDLINLVAEPSHPQPPLLAHVLKLDDAVVRELLGHGGLDPALRSSCTLLGPAEWSGDLALRAGERWALPALVAQARSAGQPLQLYFSGPRSRTKLQVALALAGAVEAPLLRVDLGYALAADIGFDVLVRRIFREARFQQAVLYAEPLDLLLSPERVAERQRLTSALAEHDGVTILAGARPGPPRGLGTPGQLPVPFPIPDDEQRERYWRAELDAAGIALGDEELVTLAGRFRLTPDQIAGAVALARNQARWRAAAESPDPQGGAPHERQPQLADLFEAARRQPDTGLDGLATKIEPVHHWDQIVLPDDTVAQLHEICQQVVQRRRVLDEWGFGRRLSLGKGVTALFAGPSGTGKTTAAEIIARELGLDLYKIDLSGVVSKYIGETEKNLERIFTEAENANCILLFDEADALFGKRSEVRDSHDRYANIEIAYLLQKMDQYDGIAILATNLRQNMDEAFVRRLSFVAEFPFPDEAQRTQIWRILLPGESRLEPDVDPGFLGTQLRVTGGSIKNVVLGAAFLAAGEGERIGMRHLLRAARREYQKLGKVLPPVDQPEPAAAAAAQPGG